MCVPGVCACVWLIKTQFCIHSNPSPFQSIMHECHRAGGVTKGTACSNRAGDCCCTGACGGRHTDLCGESESTTPTSPPPTPLHTPFFSPIILYIIIHIRIIMWLYLRRYFIIIYIYIHISPRLAQFKHSTIVTALSHWNSIDIDTCSI